MADYSISLADGRIFAARQRRITLRNISIEVATTAAYRASFFPAATYGHKVAANIHILTIVRGAKFPLPPSRYAGKRRKMGQFS